MTREERRRTLLEQAQGLREPTVEELNKPLGSVRLDSLRVATDRKLTDKLIAAGIATRFQRRTHLPRKDGRKLPTIVQLHPDGNAVAGKVRVARAPARPTVEELRSLVERIVRIENELLSEKTRAIAERIAATKRRLVDLSGDEETNAIRELAELSAARRSIAESIRRDAFARIEGDEDFPARRWLALLSHDRSD